MKNIRFYSTKYINELETFCILLIEKELDVFFSSCMKSALDYSYIISDNLTLHERKYFERKVLSSRQIKELVEDIIFKINVAIIRSIESSDIDIVSIESIDSYYGNDIFNESINNLKITQMTCKICEYIIDFAIARSLKDVCKSNIINDLVKRNISGKNILDKNNLVHQKRKHQELLYKQIEGFLINTKLSLRNELTKACIVNINGLGNINYESSIA